MTKVTQRQRLRYAFDNSMARGTSAMIQWLALVTLVAVVIFSAIIIFASLAPKDDTGHRPDVIHQIYDTLTTATKFSAFNTQGWWWALVQFLLALVSLFIVSSLVGILVHAFSAKIQELRKGRSFVVESGHTVILGWSEAVYSIVRELAIANESERDSAVVILAAEDKIKMDERLAAKVKKRGNMRIVCRSGSPIDLDDLAIVNLNESAAIIVLSGSKDDPDVEVIKTILAITHGPNRRPEPFHIVAEIEEAKNLEIARIVGGDETSVLDKGKTISRLMVQASRQSGIAIAYTELFDFAGDEIYFREDESLVGRTYGDALFAYEDCSVIGIRSGASATINPAADTPIGAGDAIIAVASDDSVLATAASFGGEIDESVIALHADPEPTPTRMLMLGWNPRARILISELNEYAAPGSVLTVIADSEDAGPVIEESSALANLTVDFRAGDATDRRLLDSLDVSSFDAMLVLSEMASLDPQQADARTLVTLLHLRDIATKSGRRVPIVSEMLDDRNRELAQVTKVDDVIVSEKVISLILAQISQNAQLATVFDDLLSAAGSEIHIRPVDRYISGATSFATIVEAAKRRGETAIGYRTDAGHDDPAQQFGVRINPAKSTRFEAAPGDRVIVLAED